MDALFKRDEGENKLRKLLFFYAPWCGPCHLVEREMIRNLEEVIGKELIERINVQENPLVAERYGVTKLPTSIIKEKDTILREYTGAIPLNEVKQILLDRTNARDGEERIEKI